MALPFAPSSTAAGLVEAKIGMSTTAGSPPSATDATDDGLEIAKRVHPWLAQTTSFAVTCVPAGSPIEDETSTSASSEGGGDDFAIASDDDEGAWIDSPSSVTGTTRTLSDPRNDFHGVELTFERLPSHALGLHKTTSMLSLALKAASISGKPPASRSRPSGPLTEVRQAHTAEASTPSTGHVPLPRSSDPEVYQGRVLSAKEVRSHMLRAELPEECRRNLDWERRWPWGRGVRSAANIRNQSAEKRQLSQMFSKPPLCELTVPSWCSLAPNGNL